MTATGTKDALSFVRGRFEAFGRPFTHDGVVPGQWRGECPNCLNDRRILFEQTTHDHMLIVDRECPCLPYQTIRLLGLGDYARPWIPPSMRPETARRVHKVRDYLTAPGAAPAGADGYERIVNALTAGGFANGSRADVDAVRGSGRFECPACGASDQKNGLKVDRTEDGRALFTCFTCGAGNEVLRALGLTWADIGAERKDTHQMGTPDDLSGTEGVGRSGAPVDGQHSGQLRMAERLVAEHGNDLRYVTRIGWHVWDGTRWSEDIDGEPDRRADATLKQALRNAIRMDQDERNRLLKDVRRCESAAGVAGILTLARSKHPLATAPKRLDADAWAFNTTAGTLDLHTGKVSGHCREDLITKCASSGVAEHVSPVWTGFLERILPDPEVRAYLARLFGLAMLGKVREHVMPVFAGSGANGKSTLRDALMHAFGDYAIEVDPALLMESKHERHGAFKMRLRGARLVFTSETSKGRRFDEATVKRLTGGEAIEANLMRENPIQFDPSHLLVMLTNHLPMVSGDDDAIWRRLFVVPFDVVIPPEERDPTLSDRLRIEAGSVLRWCLDGWTDYEKQGLNPPDSVLLRTHTYRQSLDVFSLFFAERCAEGGREKAGALYTAWSSWCKDNGEQPGSAVEFADTLSRRGYAKRKTGGSNVYLGLHLQ
jgi:putative DNA primase/helicase